AGARRGWVDVACWAAVVPCGLLALARWLGYDGGVWPLVLLPAVTPYLVLVVPIPLVFSVVVRRWTAAGVAFAVLVALVGYVAPRAFGGPDPARGRAVRVMAANLKDSTADPVWIVALVRDHDVGVLAVSELDGNELA